MGRALRHPDWYLISEQRFRRRAAVSETAQVFRGEPYVVLSDKVTGQNLRLSERARQVWTMLDGRRTAQEVWEALASRARTAPTQGEFVEWVLQLVGAGMILSDHDLDPKHLSERSEKRKSAGIEQRAASPLSIKLPLFDPSTLIRVTYPLVAPLFTRAGGLAIAALFLSALVLAIVHWEELAGSVDGALLSQSGLIALALAYPVLKILHELSHGYAVHRFGGEVREFGIMFLIFFPVPYVEASEATAFPDKRARMLVGAAGIFAELFVASVALLIWLQIEPGVERAILFNFMLIGSLSTLLFNGNPLLKFDAYFVLADWLEMPNLAARSGAYIQDRFLSRIVGLRREVVPGPGEAKILFLYGTLSLAYRMLLTITIAAIVSSLFFVVGLLLAVWAVVMAVVWPLVKMARKGTRMARMQNRTRGSVVRLALFLGVIGWLVGFVPLPFFASGEGQVGYLPRAEIIAGSSGLVGDGAARNGATVAAGDPLMTLVNDAQAARGTSAALNVTFLESSLERASLPVQTRREIERELELARASALEAERLDDALTLRAPIDGRLAWEGGRAPDSGLFVFRGDLLGRVVSSDALEIVLSFPAAFAGRLPAGDVSVDLRFPDGMRMTQRVDRARVVDAGQQVPPQLLVPAGGRVPEMQDSPGMALDAAWVAWIAPDVALESYAGSRVEARIELADATLAEQLQFLLQRLFLRVTRV